MTTSTPIVTCDVPVFYATSEGQTRRVAERIAALLAEHGHSSRAIDLQSPEAHAVDWPAVRAAIVGASIHATRHQKAARAFVKAHAAELNAVPSGFFSVSLSEASANPEEQEAARAIAARFPAAHGWTPTLVLSVAGRLAYTQYNVIIAWVMKRIAAKEGAPTDTSKDYELTNWERVDRFALALDGVLKTKAQQAA